MVSRCFQVFNLSILLGVAVGCRAPSDRRSPGIVSTEPGRSFQDPVLGGETTPGWMGIYLFILFKSLICFGMLFGMFWDCVCFHFWARFEKKNDSFGVLRILFPGAVEAVAGQAAYEGIRIGSLITAKIGR